MGNAIGTWVGIVGGACGLVVLLAGLVVAARGSYNKARIASLREDLEDSRKREGDRQGEIDTLEHKLSVVEAKLEGLLRENVVLKDLVTQRVEIGALQAIIELHHEQATVYWAKIEEALAKLFAALRAVTEVNTETRWQALEASVEHIVELTTPKRGGGKDE